MIVEKIELEKSVSQKATVEESTQKASSIIKKPQGSPAEAPSNEADAIQLEKDNTVDPLRIYNSKGEVGPSRAEKSSKEAPTSELEDFVEQALIKLPPNDLNDDGRYDAMDVVYETKASANHLEFSQLGIYTLEQYKKNVGG